jgi:hypothetical protein
MDRFSEGLTRCEAAAALCKQDNAGVEANWANMMILNGMVAVNGESVRYAARKPGARLTAADRSADATTAQLLGPTLALQDV